MVPQGLININGDNMQVLEILFLTTMIAMLPSLLVMMTSFTRYIISFSFLRTAMGTQQTPPNLVLVGLALILTLLTMAPVLDEIQETAYRPYAAEEITQTEFVQRASVPLRHFMLRNTKTSALKLFCDLSDRSLPETDAEAEALPLQIVIAAFVTCELEKGFEIGFLLYIPFLLLDVIVSSTLMSMGMVMLPPSMISMPFKLLLFVSLNGWELLFSSLVQGFR